jgi:hypothetical protein
MAEPAIRTESSAASESGSVQEVFSLPGTASAKGDARRILDVRPYALRRLVERVAVVVIGRTRPVSPKIDASLEEAGAVGTTTLVLRPGLGVGRPDRGRFPASSTAEDGLRCARTNPRSCILGSLTRQTTTHP